MCTFAPQNRTAATDSMKKCVFHIGFLVILMLCSSCVSRGVREAQEVVAQADSLWHDGQMYGIDAGDSATLAQAYETLDKSTAFCRKIREIFPFAHSTSSLGTYSHACYHYGRLLREKDDPVAAMQVFINATHSHTGDYHILGRVYSNMGSICHLAGEFPLSYDMYERCADMYLQNGDTLLYYYGLNEMAFELAEQGKKEETEVLINSVTHHCKDKSVLNMTYATRTKLYFQLQLYDSVIYVINRMYLQSDCKAYNYGLKARAYWHLGNIDSALFYANYVVKMPNILKQNKYNMLYIIANCDSSLSNDEILSISAQRSDIETDILIPLHNQWGLAVQLLEQDLNRKPNLAWVIAVLLTLVFVGLSAWIYIGRKRKQHKLISQQVEELTQQTIAIEKQKNKLEKDYIMNQKRIEDEINNQISILQKTQDLVNVLSWNNYAEMCQIVDKRFFRFASKLRHTDLLNETEIRLCVLVLIGLSRKDISSTLPYSLNGIGKLKDHTAKSLGTTGKNLREFLLKMAIEG